MPSHHHHQPRTTRSTTSTSSDKDKPLFSHTTTTSDCWSDAATKTLIHAWGNHHLNRRTLTHTHWQSLADTVNSTHHLRRTPLQCKNRIDTLKKKFKIESSKPTPSTWSHFHSLHSLIAPKTSPSPPLLLKWSVPVGPRSKRCGVVKRNVEEEEEKKDQVGGYGQLVDAIGRLGEIYERVEVEKQRQMVELEKNRMQFFKDVEIHRMKVFMESQVFIRKLARPRRTFGFRNANRYV